jgi:predicted ATPase
MKVQQLSLRNVRSIKELDLDFRDPVTGKPMSRIVLAGANGSGKTTILDCIFRLIQSLAWNKIELHYLKPDSAAYMLLQAWAEKPLETWAIGFNFFNGIFDPDSPPEYVLKHREDGRYVEWHALEEKHQYDRVKQGRVVQTALTGTQDRDSYVQSTSLLYLPDSRRLLPVEGSGVITAEKELPWAYIYRPTDQWKSSIESYLVWQNYLDLEDRDKGVKANRFQKITKAVNQFLDRKHIVGVERGRVIVEVDGQQKHGLYDLSSGERQIVMLLIEITRQIKHGGIILIDEPEISLHSTWQRGLMAALDKVVEEHDTQIILATHSLEIASWVMPYEVISLNDLGLPRGKWEPEKEAIA